MFYTVKFKAYDLLFTSCGYTIETEFLMLRIGLINFHCKGLTVPQIFAICFKEEAQVEICFCGSQHYATSAAFHFIELRILCFQYRNTMFSYIRL